MLSGRGYRNFGGDWFSFRDRKGFSKELIEDSNSPLVLNWINQKLKTHVPAGEFTFYALAVATDAAGMAARLESMGVRRLNVRIEKFAA